MQNFTVQENKNKSNLEYSPRIEAQFVSRVHVRKAGDGSRHRGLR